MARREQVTPMMEMVLMILMLMEVMMVMVETVEMVETMETVETMGMMTMMMITMHRWLRDGLRRSTTTWRVMATTTPRPRSGCCSVRKTCRRLPIATWCRSPASTSVGL